MSEEQVEKVARAIYERDYGGDLHQIKWPDLPSAESGHYRELARAAIAAMDIDRQYVDRKEFEIARTASRVFEAACNTWMERALTAEATGVPLGDANAACLELAAAHGFATGHGDTVADMIREFSAQIHYRHTKEEQP